MLKTCYSCGNGGPFQSGQALCRDCRSTRDRERRFPLTQEVPPISARSENQSRVSDRAPAEVLNAVDQKKVVREPVVTVEALTPVEEHRLKVKNADLARQVKLLTEQLSDAQGYADTIRQAAEATESVEPISIRERKSGLLEGTAQVLFSDVHIEEEVKPEQVAGRNRYNLEISKGRCERFFQATRWGIDLNRQAYKIRDMVLWLGGDIITGYLHPDNVESNLLSPVEAIAEAFTRVKAGIDYLLRDGELERIVVPCNDGNHGRLTEKMRSAARVQNSIEWLLYKMLADHYVSEPRVQFILPQGAHTYFEVYGETIHYHHGDEAKYGGGVGGIMIPLRKWIDRINSVRPARLHVVGHFHQRINTDDLIVNGSVIGYGPYSFSIGARFEPPCQDFTILDAKRWRGPSMGLWVADREDDQGV